MNMPTLKVPDVDLTTAEKCLLLPAIQDDDQFDFVADKLHEVNDLKKEIKATFAPIVKAAHEAHKAAKAAENEKLKPVESAEKHLGRLMGAWKAKKEQELQEALRIEEQRLREEQEREREALVAELAINGNVEQARALSAAPKPEVHLKADFPAVGAENTSFRTSWKYEITDESLIPRHYLQPNTSAIGATVRSLKDKAPNTIPGIRVWSETAAHARK